MLMKKNIFIGMMLGCLLLMTDMAWAQEKAYPKNGEGITLFLRRFDRNTAAYRREFIRLNKNKLGKDQSLKMGVQYTIPPLMKEPTAPRSNYEPLFGKEYASYQETSSELKGACFYLVSGHGGPDPGAIGTIGNHKLHEDEYAYDITLRLARNLLTKGAKVYIIIQDAKDGIRDDRYLENSKRETCMGSTIPFNQVRRLQQRCDKVNSLFKQDREGYKRALYVHIDSRSKSRQTDVYFYYKPKSSQSKRLAKTMKQTFAQKYKKHQPGRGFEGTVDDRNLYVLNNTTPATVFVELGNIQNSFDQQRLILSNNRQALANWLAESFVNDYQRYKKKLK